MTSDLDHSLASEKYAIFTCLLLRDHDIIDQVTVLEASLLTWVRSSVDRASDF